MLKIGKLTDYAIAVMVQLAKEGVSRSAKHLSQKTGISEPTVAKVLKGLAKAKLVESERGVTGGYKMVLGIDEVTVGHIIEAMDGPIAIVSCVEVMEKTCGASATCPAKGKWNPVNEAIKAALFSVSLSDMAPQETARKLYKISGGTHVLHE